MNSVPNRPAISDVLVKASANCVFRDKLLTNSHEALADMNLSAEDYEILSTVQASSLKDYARQLKVRLLMDYAR